MEFQSQKTYILEHFQEYRIIQPTVVFIHGLPSSFSHTEVLQRQLSQLGNTFRIKIQYLNKDFYSAFIEFQNDLSAALLITMLNEMTLQNRQLRVFYGSTKFCPHFLKNHQCLVPNCNYAHYYIPHLIHLRDQAKEINHSSIAHMYVYQQLYLTAQIARKISFLHQDQSFLLCLGKQRLDNLMRQYCISIEPVSPSIQEPEIKEEVQWTTLEKEISSQTSSIPEQKRVEGTSPKVQQFLDEAERFLTKLIFESSVFVY